MSVTFSDSQVEDYLTVEIFKILRNREISQSYTSEYLMTKAVDIFQEMRLAQFKARKGIK